jgi:hypothetical protein
VSGSRQHRCTVAAAAYGADPDDVWVTFDPVYDENATLYPGTYDINPNYGHDSHDLHDVAVIILDEPIPSRAEDPVNGIDPAALPPAGLLDDMKKAHELKGHEFVTVGYGRLRDEKTKGPAAMGSAGDGRVVDGHRRRLVPRYRRDLPFGYGIGASVPIGVCGPSLTSRHG